MKSIRNILSWINKGQTNKVKILVSQAFLGRITFAIFSQFIIIIYSYYISRYQFGGKYFYLFIVMMVSGIAQAGVDSGCLLLKAFNRYVLSASVSYSVSSLGKFLSLFIFYFFGFKYYLYSVIIMPFIGFIVVFVILRKWIEFRHLQNINHFIKNIKDAKHFTSTTYLYYGRNNLDQLLVSIFLPTDIIGSFSVAKKMFSIGKVFIENIFDPMMQKLISYKGNYLKLEIEFDRIKKIQKILLAVGTIAVIILFLTVNDILVLLNLNSYPSLGIFITLIAISQIIHVGIKVKSNIISLFYDSIIYFKFNFYTSLLSMLFLISFLKMGYNYIFLYLVITYLIQIPIMNYFINRNSDLKYAINGK